MPAKSPEPSKITLKFGGQKSTGTPAMSVDNEALKRQQDLVRAGANGHATATGKSRFEAYSIDEYYVLIHCQGRRLHWEDRSVNEAFRHLKYQMVSKLRLVTRSRRRWVLSR